MTTTATTTEAETNQNSATIMSAPGEGAHDERMHGHHGETRVDIDEDTPVDKVRAPNVFERAKEEIEALSQTIRAKRSSEAHGMHKDIDKTALVNNVKAPNVFERVKEEIEALSQKVHEKRSSETHGMRKDIDETTPLSDVKAPNMFERAQEEIEALVQTIHLKKEPQPKGKETHGVRKDIDESTPTDEVKAPNVLERAKEEIDALVQTINQKKNAQPSEPRDQTTQPATVNSDNSSSGKNKASDFIKKAKDDIKDKMLAKLSPRHHKKSQGENSQIDKGTPLSKLKGPNVFERAKEEIDALVEVIHKKKEAKKEFQTATQGSEGAGAGGR